MKIMVCVGCPISSKISYDEKDNYDIDYTQTTTGWAKEATVTLTAIPASMSSHQASTYRL